MQDLAARIDTIQREVDRHERILLGDGMSEQGVQTQLALIRLDLNQLKWGVRLLLGAGATWLVTRLFGVIA